MQGPGGLIQNGNGQIIPDLDEEGETKFLLLLLILFRDHFLLLFRILPKYYYEISHWEHMNSEKIFHPLYFGFFVL